MPFFRAFFFFVYFGIELRLLKMNFYLIMRTKLYAKLIKKEEGGKGERSKGKNFHTLKLMLSQNISKNL